jgi:hypothetical protein
MAAVAVVAGTLLSLGRTPGVGATNTVWLEDGTIFLQDAATKSPLVAIATPYSGYYHLVPRLFAEIAVLFPPGAAAAVMAVEAAAFTAFLAIVVFVASGSHLKTTLARLLVSVPLVLMPAGYTELPNAINELRWPLMYAMFWILLWTPATRRGRILALTIIGLASFTDNVVGIFLVLALLRLWSERDLIAKFAVVSLAAGFLLNVTTNLTGLSEHDRIHPVFAPLWALEAFVVRPVPQGLLGEALVTERASHDLRGLAPVFAGWLLLAVFAVIARRRWSRPHWPLAVLAFVYGCALYMAIVMIAGAAVPRYSGPASLFTIVVAVALLRPSDGAALPLDRRLVPVLLLTALMTVVAVVNYRGAGSFRGTGPAWDQELAKARAVCAAGATTAQVQVAPVKMNWYAVLPCSYLQR